MTAIPFDKRPLSHPSPVVRPNLLDWQLHDGDTKDRAVAELLRHEVISHAFGPNGEYEVRTTIATRRAWQYRCSILRHGKTFKRVFFPIDVKCKPHAPNVDIEAGGTEAMRLDFARDAVEVHFTRCAMLREYLMLAAIYSQPPPEPRRRYTLLAFLIGSAFLMAYGFWAHIPRTNTGQPPESPPLPVQTAPSPVVERPPMSAPLSVPLPEASDTASHKSNNAQTDAARIPRLAEPPKTVRLNDLIALEDSPERGKHALRAPTPQASPRSMGSDVQAGDLLLFAGWIHRVSRGPDSTYYLQVSPSPKARAPGLIAVVPPPDQASDSPAVRAQLQTVHAFVTQRLLRQQKASPRGSAMKNPVFVQLTGQLSHPGASIDEPSRGKRSRDAAARWEVHPVLEVRFVKPPLASGHSRPK
jgi:hypothetical protein